MRLVRLPHQQTYPRAQPLGMFFENMLHYKSHFWTRKDIFNLQCQVPSAIPGHERFRRLKFLGALQKTEFKNTLEVLFQTKKNKREEKRVKKKEKIRREKR